MRRPKPPLPTVGWREWLALPELGIDRVKVKVDTGARTSAIHALDVETYEQDGEDWVQFLVHPIQKDTETTLDVRARLIDQREVRPSTGKATVRPVILTHAELGGLRWPIELTLVRRDMMGFRMLLGRQALRHRFLVDPGRSFLQGKGNR